MADWKDDRFPDRTSGGDPYRDRVRHDEEEERDRSRDFSRGGADDDWNRGRSSRWASGNYRQNDAGSYGSTGREYPRSGSGSRWGADRDEVSGDRGGGYLGGDYRRDDFSGRTSGGGYAGYDSRGPEGGGYGRADNERSAEFGGNYARSAGSNIYRTDYTSGESGVGRSRGMSGNYLGGGGGYGTARDYESAPGHEYGMSRGRDLGHSPWSSERQSFRGRGPKNFQRSDERIRELVSERLHDHDAIDASDIEVSVTNGEVTLAGTVDDRRTKLLAEELAESVSGVRDVHNSLKVDRGFFSRMAEKVRDAMSDTRKDH